METIGIIDYGSGNIHSATKAFETAAKDINKEVRVIRVSKADGVIDCDRIVLPGVGSFGDCKTGIDQVDDLYQTINMKVKDYSTPFLGICVGMQLLADLGTEGGETKGFGWINGIVEKIPSKEGIKIPHMGWNEVHFNKDHKIIDSLKNGQEGMVAYFVHSYHFQLKDEKNLLGYCDYGSKITAIIEKNNIIGCQFHPEKSQKIGLKFIKNFLNWNI
jgi:glutamine amidotransferase